MGILVLLHQEQGIQPERIGIREDGTVDPEQIDSKDKGILPCFHGR